MCSNLTAREFADVRQCSEGNGMGLLYLPPSAFAPAGIQTRLQSARAAIRKGESIAAPSGTALIRHHL
jgi:hypothetical protein